MSDYEQHLLSYLDPSKIMTLSCGHVIPSSNLLAVPVVRTLSGQEFDFTFEKRNSEQMVIFVPLYARTRVLTCTVDRPRACHSRGRTAYTRWCCRLYPQLLLSRHMRRGLETASLHVILETVHGVGRIPERKTYLPRTTQPVTVWWK